MQPPGSILPGHKLHIVLVSALYAGGERILDAGRYHEAPARTVEGAVSSGDVEGAGAVYSVPIAEAQPCFRSAMCNTQDSKSRRAGMPREPILI